MFRSWVRRVPGRRLHRLGDHPRDMSDQMLGSQRLQSTHSIPTISACNAVCSAPMLRRGLCPLSNGHDLRCQRIDDCQFLVGRVSARVGHHRTANSRRSSAVNLASARSSASRRRTISSALRRSRAAPLASAQCHAAPNPGIAHRTPPRSASRAAIVPHIPSTFPGVPAQQSRAWFKSRPWVATTSASFGP